MGKVIPRIYIGVILPFQKVNGRVINLGARKRHMPGVIPGEMPGGYFPLLFPPKIGRLREKGNLPPRYEVNNF